MRKQLILIGVILLLGSGSVVAWSWLGKDSAVVGRIDQNAKTQKPAPDYRFAVLDAPEKTQSPVDWRGQTVFINFFASWCVPCHAEHPLLEKLRTQTTRPIIGIGHYDRPADTQKMLAALGNPYTLVLEDKMGRGGKSWGLNGVPESFILDAQGLIVWNHRGPLTEKIMQDEILPLLRTIETR